MPLRARVPNHAWGRRVSDDELERGHRERAARTADELLSVALGSTGGDLDQELARVGDKDSAAVLGAVLREIASLTATRRLRDERPDESASAAVPMAGEDLPPDPWASGEDDTSNALEDASILFGALADQRTVADLLRAVGSLDESDAMWIVFERALAAMAERLRPSD